MKTHSDHELSRIEAVGRSLVNIVPTRNTDLAQTVTIYVHEPYLSKVSASSLKLTGSGALRFL